MQLTVKTGKRTEFVDITNDVQTALDAALSAEKSVPDHHAAVLIYVPHTTAAVTINENADPHVPRDILKVLNRVVPFDFGYRHMEGNSAAHVKSSLFGVSEIVALDNGRLALGTWQSIFFCEFDGPRTRNVRISCIGGKRQYQLSS